MMYTVTRFCCLSGMCFDCRAVGDKNKRLRVVQADHLTKEQADRHMAGWAQYSPEMVEEKEAVGQ